jgi:hypothetical protein
MFLQIVTQHHALCGVVPFTKGRERERERENVEGKLSNTNKSKKEHFISDLFCVWASFDSRYLLALRSKYSSLTLCYQITSVCVFLLKSRDSSVGIALGYGLDDRGSRVRFPAGARNFSLHHRLQNGSGPPPLQPPTQCVTGALSVGESGWGVKLTTHLHLVPKSRMSGAIPPLPQLVFMMWCLVKHRDNFACIFTFTFTLTVFCLSPLSCIAFSSSCFRSDYGFSFTICFLYIANDNMIIVFFCPNFFKFNLHKNW